MPAILMLGKGLLLVICVWWIDNVVFTTAPLSSPLLIQASVELLSIFSKDLWRLRSVGWTELVR